MQEFHTCRGATCGVFVEWSFLNCGAAHRSHTSLLDDAWETAAKEPVVH